VRLTTDRLERVAPRAELRTEHADLVIERSRPHQSGFIVAFEGFGNRNEAEALRGSKLFATPIDDPAAVWVHDLIGTELQDEDGTDRGTVVAVQENPASDLLVTDAGALVPLTFFVERRGNVVVIRPPRGLFSLEE